MTYSKISAEDVYRAFVGAEVCIMSDSGLMPVRLVAERLKTSRYQAYKQIRELVRQGILKTEFEYFDTDDDYSLPYRGFVLTQKGRETDYYKEQAEREIEYINETFNKRGGETE